MMTRFIRFIRELRTPSLKCNRLGHDDRTETRKIRRSCEGRHVVEDFLATFTVCKRCRREVGPSEEVEIDWFNSCSMPTSMWDQMRDNGYVEI